MAERTLFFIEDTVGLKSEPSETSAYLVGIVDRTFSNVESHSPNPEQDALTGSIGRGNNVDMDAFFVFLNTGVPPRGTVLVTWVLSSSPDPSLKESILISETELDLIDRALLFGDVVKSNPLDAMSGTVIQARSDTAIVHCLAKFHPIQSQNAPVSLPNSLDWIASKDRVLQNVPVDELRWANEYERDDVILYKDWAGLIQEIDADVYVRLANNSVVIPEDCADLFGPDDPAIKISVRVTTRKANLRRGRWIYGAYDANVAAEGIICDIRPRSLAVQWLTSRFPKEATSFASEPPPELGRDELEGGAIHVYDRLRLPDQSNRKGLTLRRPNLDVGLSELVRFRDLNHAAEKYKANPDASDSGNQGTLKIIPRGDTLGFDVNVFKIVNIKTSVDVLWQDGTVTSDLAATSLSPYSEYDNEEEVWPGEVVMTKEEVDPLSDYFTPVRAGVVQSVNAQDRMARVTWFASSTMALTRDHPTWLLPGSHTSKVSGQSGEISLYDVFRTNDFSRRLGDLVILFPSPIMDRADEDLMGLKDLQAIIQADSVQVQTETSDSRMWWFGEVIELGLDGLLTVRLGACSPPREVRIPWECTSIAYSLHQEEPTDGFGSLDLSDDSDEYRSENGSITSSMISWEEHTLERRPEGVWRDPDGNEIDEDKSNQWSTDEESGSVTTIEDADVVMTDDADIGMADVPPPSTDTRHEQAGVEEIRNNLDGSTEPQTMEHLTETNVDEAFSYSNMFAKIGDNSGVEQPLKFAILEGSLPNDHHFAHRMYTMDGKTLRHLHKEHKIMRDALPDGAYVRTWESNLNMMRVLLLGPLETPYEYAPFVFDFYMDSTFPRYPPQVFFHSWTDGRGPCNPNLYEDGKVCLSLLGTWPGDDKNEGWVAGKSTILQIIVSLLGLVLVKEPYFNEAGFEVRVGSIETRIPSAQYSERAFFNTRYFIARALQTPLGGFEKEIVALYLGSKELGHPRLLRRAIESGIDVIHRSRTRPPEASTGMLERRVTAGALAPLTRNIGRLLDKLSEDDAEDAKLLRITLDGS